ncbi:MAG: hypothetical protein WBM86_22380 [Waterburya sp.]
MYKNYLNSLYKWKESEIFNKLVENPNERQTQLRALNTSLGELALKILSQGKNRSRIMQNFILEEIGEAQLNLAKPLGLLNLVDQDKETEEPCYAFYHPTFLEYFAATAIETWDYFLPREHEQAQMPILDESGNFKPYRIFEQRWQEVIVFWLGQTEEKITNNQKDEFLKALVKFQDGCGNFYWYRAFFLLAIVISEYKELAKEELNYFVNFIVELSFGDFNEKRQHWSSYFNHIEESARASLLETPRAVTIDALLYLLANPNLMQFSL